MVDNRERECFRRWMWFRVNPRLMRTLRFARELPRLNEFSLVKTTHLKRRFDDWIKHIATCSGLPADFLSLFFETFSVTWDEMWLLADYLQDDCRCIDYQHMVDYFPNDTFPELEMHRINQLKGNIYQVDQYGGRPAAIYIRLDILDSEYIDTKIIEYKDNAYFKYSVRP